MVKMTPKCSDHAMQKIPYQVQAAYSLPLAPHERVSVAACPCNVSPAKHTRTTGSFYSKALLLTSQEDPERRKWSCLNTPLCDMSAPD